MESPIDGSSELSSTSLPWSKDATRARSRTMPVNIARKAYAAHAVCGHRRSTESAQNSDGGVRLSGLRSPREAGGLPPHPGWGRARERLRRLCRPGRPSAEGDRLHRLARDHLDARPVGADLELVSQLQDRFGLIGSEPFELDVFELRAELRLGDVSREPAGDRVHDPIVFADAFRAR